MSRFQAAIVYMAAGAILAAGLMFILRPAPTLSQSDPALQSTLNAIMAKLDRMDKKLDSINGRIGQVRGSVTSMGREINQIYSRSTRGAAGPWER